MKTNLDRDRQREIKYRVQERICNRTPLIKESTDDVWGIKVVRANVEMGYVDSHELESWEISVKLDCNSNVENVVDEIMNAINEFETKKFSNYNFKEYTVYQLREWGFLIKDIDNIIVYDDNTIRLIKYAVVLKDL